MLAGSVPGGLLVDFDSLLQNDLAAETLVAEIGIVDAGLVAGDHLARGAEHVRQTLGDDRIVIRSSAQRHRRQTEYRDQEYAEHGLIEGIGPIVPADSYENSPNGNL